MIELDVKDPVKEQLLKAVDSLPPLSPVLKKVLDSLADEQVEFGQLAKVIETDPVLSGQLLRVVNSPLYGRRSSVTSVRHSVAILGALKTRNVILGLCIAGNWSRAGVPRRWTLRQFNQHSLAVAVLSDLLALELPVVYPEGGFVAGLLHDVGKLAIAVGLPDQFDVIYDMWERGEKSVVECEAEVLGCSHAELSADIAARWLLPLPIRSALANHHDAGTTHTLAEVVRAADSYVSFRGIAAGPHACGPQLVEAEPSAPIQEALVHVAESFDTEYKALTALV